MSPTQHRQHNPLFYETTSRRALLRAWANVGPRVVKSSDATTRAAAQVFARDPERNVHRLQRELRSNQFVFAPQRGVLKYKKAEQGAPRKAPRPIVVSPIQNRIVQRAILDTCQTDKPNISRRLGNLTRIIETPTSVGGLPRRGVPEGIELISAAINDGATWFVRSDLKSFFQNIPKPTVERFLQSNISDQRFVSLFLKALDTELENETEVRELIHLFPLGSVGVPQGSALSALCANIVLADFDRELNGRGIRTIRYLDDFVILGPSKKAVLKAWSKAKFILKPLGMECHDPGINSGKASMGRISDGFDFLSFHIDSKNIYPSKNACSDFLAELRNTIREAKRSIRAASSEPRRAEPCFIQSLFLLDQKIRGWGDAFSPTTMRVVFAQLDSKVDSLLDDYLKWFKRLRRNKSVAEQRRLMGIALLDDTRHSGSNLTSETRQKLPSLVSTVN